MSYHTYRSHFLPTRPILTSHRSLRESCRQDTMPVLAMVQDHLSYSRLILTDVLPARVVTTLLGPSIDNMSPTAAAASASDHRRSIDLQPPYNLRSQSGSRDAAESGHSCPLPSRRTEHSVLDGGDPKNCSTQPRPPDQPQLFAGLQTPAASAAPSPPKRLQLLPGAIGPPKIYRSASSAAAPPKRLQSLPGTLLFPSAFGSGAGIPVARTAQAPLTAPQRFFSFSLPGAPCVPSQPTHLWSPGSITGTPAAGQPDSRRTSLDFEEHACVTVFFSDICGFSTWAHQLHPSIVMGTLNDLYSRWVWECVDIHRPELHSYIPAR